MSMILKGYNVFLLNWIMALYNFGNRFWERKCICPENDEISRKCIYHETVIYSSSAGAKCYICGSHLLSLRGKVLHMWEPSLETHSCIIVFQENVLIVLVTCSPLGTPLGSLGPGNHLETAWCGCGRETVGRAYPGITIWCCARVAGG